MISKTKLLTFPWQRRLLLLLSLLCCCAWLPAQTAERRHTPSFALKSNIAYDAVGSFNLGAEFRVSPRLTLDVPLVYNPLSFSDNRKWKHFLFQPRAALVVVRAFQRALLRAAHALRLL